MELFTQLFNMVLIGAIGYWSWKVSRPEAYPFKTGIYNFIFTIGCILIIFLPIAETSKFVSGAFACHFAFMGTVPLITNDYKKYKRDAESLINSMTFLIALTGILILIMNYPNTKQMLHSFIIGFAAAFVRGWFVQRKAAILRTENL